jgi:hypothetical protein
MMLSISNGKTNRWGKRQYGAVIRNRDPLICSHSALAQYFFYRWHQSGEAPPSFKSRRDWYNTKILVGSNEQNSISFRQQYNDIDNLFREVGVASDSITHAPRKMGPQSAEFHGVSESQVSLVIFPFPLLIHISTYMIAQITRAGRWDHTAMTNAYLGSFPMKFLRRMAGFSVNGGSYFVARAHVQPPLALLKKVFPWLLKWEVRFRARLSKKDWSQGGLDESDLAGQSFLNLLAQLRVVLLQDLAVLQPGNEPFCITPHGENYQWAI